MKEKKIISSELIYVLATLVLALGTALMAKADFGISMVTGPSYILHLKLVKNLSWFSFGVAEYLFQGVVLILLSIIVKRAKRSYLFSFVSAFLFGLSLDMWIYLIRVIPSDSFYSRLCLYLLGMVTCSLGVSLYFKTYISPCAYEYFVKDVAAYFKVEISKVKTIYDLSSTILGIILSFSFFGLWHFEGIKAGTFLCALINGSLIGYISKLLDNHFIFKDSFKLRCYFEA